jgi:glutamate formiminotransferase
LQVIRPELLESMFCSWMPDTPPRSAPTAGMLLKGTAKDLLSFAVSVATDSMQTSKPLEI